MTEATNPNSFDFNDAGAQTERRFDPIPKNTLVNVQLSIKPGGAGREGMLTRASTDKGESEHLNMALTVIDGEHAKRKVFDRPTVAGKNHAAAIDISFRRLRAIIDAANNLRPADMTDAAKAVRERYNKSWREFDGARFQIIVDVAPPGNGFAAKNTISMVVTPEMEQYKRLDQIDRSTLASPAAAIEPAAPAAAIVKPDWAK